MITGFGVENWKRRVFSSLGLLPVEDSYKFRELGKGVVVGAVADGITRDFKDGKPFCKDFSGLAKVLKGKYPNPSPARKAADTFCNSFISYASIEPYVNNTDTKRETGCNEKLLATISDSFEFANSSILRRNTSLSLYLNPNYLERDLAGCVASGFLVRGRNVFYGFICDSGVALYDAKGNLVEKTKAEVNSGESHIPGFDWKNDFYRRMWRGQIRNFPADLQTDEEIKARIALSYQGILTPEIIRETRFGALTGEQEALGYVRTGRRELKEGEVVVLHTDGMTPLLNQGKFIDNLRAGVKNRNFSKLKRFCRRKVSSEGTLVLYSAEV